MTIYGNSINYVAGNNGDIVTSDGAIYSGSTSTFLASALQRLDVKTLSGSTTVYTFTSDITSNYKFYRLCFFNCYIGVSSGTFKLVVSSDNGSTYDTGNNYAYTIRSLTAGAGSGSASNLGAVTRPAILLNNPNTNLLSGHVDIVNLSSKCFFNWLLLDHNGSTIRGSGVYTQANAVNALKITLSTASSSSGNMVLYGRK